MDEHLSADALETAVATLFEQNNYTVDKSRKLAGGQIDLVCRREADPFSSPIYIEVTSARVDNEKYGKDLTKLVVAREQDPTSQLLIVSSSGFTADVIERATAARIRTLTYKQLFDSFGGYTPYVSRVLDIGVLAEELQQLAAVYEPPLFRDAQGTDPAVEYMDQWLDGGREEERWLIVVGEYGTGKTALTRRLLHHWMGAHRADPSRPIPVRIELRDFAKQFDADGLLLHFMHSNGLGDFPLGFLKRLVSDGRIVLLLDGYDEMAQYLHSRERRACLEALASLAQLGARGVLTSRPNYFSEAEELQVAQSLYSAFVYQHATEDEIAEMMSSELALDDLITRQFIDRHERTLQDLSEDQTAALVRRVLADQPQQAEAVLGILHRVFRETGDSTLSLSGKPIIIAYLIQIVEELPTVMVADVDHSLSEYSVYELIIQQLMERDRKRAPEIPPSRRLAFLENLAVQFTVGGVSALSEDDFFEFVRKDFEMEIKRSSDNPHDHANRLFADLRSSTTLTRSSGAGGFAFSHNSLREFLACRWLIRATGDPEARDVVLISDAMRLFAHSLEADRKARILTDLAASWSDRRVRPVLCSLFNLMWGDPTRDQRDLLDVVAGGGATLDGTRLERIRFGDEAPVGLDSASFSESVLLRVEFRRASLERASFDGCLLDGVSFNESSLRSATFRGATFYECDFSSCDFEGAVLDPESDASFIVDGTRLEGPRAIGYLVHLGAVAEGIDPMNVLCHADVFPIAAKICRYLLDGKRSEWRGLVRRGLSAQNPVAAESFLRMLIKSGYVTGSDGPGVLLTDEGRPVVMAFAEGTAVSPPIVDWFEQRRQ